MTEKKKASQPTRAAKPVISSYEAKLLYTLLDAAHDDGRLRGLPLEPRWLAIRSQAVSFPAVDRASLYLLVEELHAAGIFHNTWMQERWLKVKRRVEHAPMEFPSQSPFLPPPPN